MSEWRVKLEVIVTMTGVTGDYFTDSSCVQLILDISPMVTTATGEIYSSRYRRCESSYSGNNNQRRG